MNIFRFLDFDFSYDSVIKNSDNVELLFRNSFNMCNSYKIEEAYNLTQKIIEKTVSSGDYIRLFIAMFNSNVLLRQLKYNLNPEIHEKYKNIKEYDLESRYNNLTNQIKIAVAPVFNFINFSDIYKHLHSSIKDLNKIRSDVNSIGRGNIVYNSDIYSSLGTHLNLLNFVLSNKIMVEPFAEFNEIIKNRIEIAVLRQTQNSSATLNRAEVFSCIKYLKYNELEILLKEYYKKDFSKRGTFYLKDEDRDWLINTVLKNCIAQHSIDNSIADYIKKALFILSIIKLSDGEIESVCNIVRTQISEKSNDIMIFESINLFFGLQHNIYKTDIKRQVLIDFIDVLIEKINTKLNGYEMRAITDNYLSNLYEYASLADAIYKNEDNVKKLIESISKYFNTETKIAMIQNFVLNIYRISNDSVKNIIRNYVVSTEFTEEINKYKTKIPDYKNDDSYSPSLQHNRDIAAIYDKIKLGVNAEKLIMLNNSLIMLSIKNFTEENLNEIQDFIEPYTKSNGSSFNFILPNLAYQIDYIIKNNHMEEGLTEKLTDVLKKIKDLIKNFKEIERRSII